MLGTALSACAPGAQLPSTPPAARTATPAADTRPNIVLIVADDLGYSDIGAFGGEIPTPNLDALAKNGAQLANFYVSPACSPTRAMLLTGRDNHAAGFGTMVEAAVGDQRGAPGYEGHIPQDVPTIAERLRDAGYRTMMSGKWHLGAAPGQGPSSRGFDYSFSLMQGMANHFGADQSPGFSNNYAAPTYRLNGEVVTYPEGEFSSHVINDRLMSFLPEDSAEGPEARKPFFAYLAFTAPHWPVQAPAEAIARHKGRYDAGPGAIMRDRIARLKETGLVPKGMATRMDLADEAWAKLTPQQRETQARTMEVYAAMVEDMDAEIGRLVDRLKAEGELENTYIVFMSDNGPEGLIFNRPVNPRDPLTPLPVDVDNSVSNIGAANSWLSYGPAWGQASAAPFWGTKEYTSEGGIRSAAIVSGPGIPGGTRERSALHVRDIFPTFLSIAGVEPDVPSPDGEMAPLDMLPLLEDPAEGPMAREGDLFWELFYRAAIRRGDMKAIYQPTRVPVLGPFTAPGEVFWQLYDLAADPGETDDLAAIHPETLEQLKAEWRRHADELGVVLLPEDR
ncbi:arylsulfatase [Croceicoccus sediminis]|uniref:arylsulfatase n=1 Tax=Croceicoccus sediminis TaxID=2571150 RepID=UPI0014790C53|nr:arylsulfatase [Croceicoccus sediminis]